MVHSRDIAGERKKKKEMASTDNVHEVVESTTEMASTDNVHEVVESTTEMASTDNVHEVVESTTEMASTDNVHETRKLAHCFLNALIAQLQTRDISDI